MNASYAVGAARSICHEYDVRYGVWSREAHTSRKAIRKVVCARCVSSLSRNTASCRLLNAFNPGGTHALDAWRNFILFIASIKLLTCKIYDEVCAGAPYVSYVHEVSSVALVASWRPTACLFRIYAFDTFYAMMESKKVRGRRGRGVGERKEKKGESKRERRTWKALLTLGLISSANVDKSLAEACISTCTLLRSFFLYLRLRKAD